MESSETYTRSSSTTTMKKFVFSNTAYDDAACRISSKLAQSQASQDQGFVFINVTSSQDEKKRKHMQKVVRSAATTYSHRVQPRGAPKSEVTMKMLRPTQRNRAPEQPMSAKSEQPSRSESSGTTIHKGTTSAAKVSRKRLPTHKQHRRESSPKRKERSPSPGPVTLWVPDPSFMDASMKDPFDSYPVTYRKWYGQLISFWSNVVFARSTRVLRTTKEELDAYSLWSRRQELSEPALFYTALYLASGIPVAEGLFPVQAALWLRLKTVEAMKEALDDPKRATSTPVILAVGRIALHEHIYGNRELAHNVHRPAQRRMINMRGGLANMDLPATTIQLIVWTDSLLSAEMGTEPYFADVPRQIAIKSYSPQEAMHVTNHCSPRRSHHPGYDGPIIAEVPEDE